MRDIIITSKYERVKAEGRLLRQKIIIEYYKKNPDTTYKRLVAHYRANKDENEQSFHSFRRDIGRLIKQDVIEIKTGRFRTVSGELLPTPPTYRVNKDKALKYLDNIDKTLAKIYSMNE